MINRIHRRLKYYCLRMIRTNNGNHSVAIGLTLGFFPCWFPTFGIGMVASVALSRVFKGSIPAAVLSAILGSFTWPVLFFLNYKVGSVIRSLFYSGHVEFEEVILSPPPVSNYEETFEGLQRLGNIGTDFLVGSVTNSILFSLLGYGAVLLLLHRYRHFLLSKLRSPGIKEATFKRQPGE